MIALDENRGAWSGAVLGEPDREVSRTAMLTRCLVYVVGIGPDAEVADVKHVIEAHAERCLEGDDVIVEPIHGSMDVAGGANEHVYVTRGR